MAQTLLAGIDAAGGILVEPYTQAEATTQLDENEIPFALTIPQGFTAGVAEDRPVTLHFVNHPDADLQKAEAVRLVVEGVARDMSLEIQLLAAL